MQLRLAGRDPDNCWRASSGSVTESGLLMRLLPSRRTRSALVPLVLLAASTAALAAQERFYLHDKDTVVFYGDSITEQRLYTAFVETFVLTRYPQLNVRFVNAGWGDRKSVV